MNTYSFVVLEQNGSVHVDIVEHENLGQAIMLFKLNNPDSEIIHIQDGLFSNESASVAYYIHVAIIAYKKLNQIE
jgi:hypothetical protein